MATKFRFALVRYARATGTAFRSAMGSKKNALYPEGAWLCCLPRREARGWCVGRAQPGGGCRRISVLFQRNKSLIRCRLAIA
jgi:hypothetical protein